MATSMPSQDWHVVSKVCQKGLTLIAIWLCLFEYGRREEKISLTNISSQLISGTGTTNGNCLATFQEWMSCHLYHALSTDGSHQHSPGFQVPCQDITVRIALCLRDISVPNIAATHWAVHCCFTGKCLVFFSQD